LKVGILFAGELMIEGTIGVTVDRQKVILVHFDDRVIRGEGGCVGVGGGGGDQGGDGVSLGGLCLATSEVGDAEECTRLLGADTAEALSTLLHASASLSPGARSGRRALSGLVSEITYI